MRDNTDWVEQTGLCAHTHHISVHMSIYLSVHMPIRKYACISTRVPKYMSMHMSVCMSIRGSMDMSISTLQCRLARIAAWWWRFA